MTDEELRERLLAVDEDIRVRREQFVAMKARGQGVEAETLRAESRALFQTRHKLAVLTEFRRTVPVRWTHDASRAEMEAKITLPALVAAAKDCAEGSRNVLLLGPTGVGKTLTLALLVRRFYVEQRSNRFRAVRWFYARELAAAVFGHPLGKGEAPEVRRACDAPVLVLDDLGLERDHGAILDVLDVRYRNSLPTWASSGLTVTEIRDRYGEALYRRLVSPSAPGRVVTCFPSELKAVAR